MREDEREHFSVVLLTAETHRQTAGHDLCAHRKNLNSIPAQNIQSRHQCKHRIPMSLHIYFQKFQGLDSRPPQIHKLEGFQRPLGILSIIALQTDTDLFIIFILIISKCYLHKEKQGSGEWFGRHDFSNKYVYVCACVCAPVDLFPHPWFGRCRGTAGRGFSCWQRLVCCRIPLGRWHTHRGTTSCLWWSGDRTNGCIRLSVNILVCYRLNIYSLNHHLLDSWTCHSMARACVPVNISDHSDNKASEGSHPLTSPRL